MADCLLIARRRRHASFSERFDEYIEAIDKEFHLPLGKVVNKLRRLSDASSKSRSTSISESSSLAANVSEFQPELSDSRSEFPFPAMPESEPKMNTPTRLEPEDEDDDLHWRPSVTYPPEFWRERHESKHSNERTTRLREFGRRMSELIHVHRRASESLS